MSGTTVPFSSVLSEIPGLEVPRILRSKVRLFAVLPPFGTVQAVLPLENGAVLPLAR